MEEKENLEQEVEVTIEDQLKESEEKHLRLYAEFENYKRRVQKEKEELVLNTKTKMRLYSLYEFIYFISQSIY